MLNKAIEFAVKAHKDGYRKGTNIPYILHPLEAAVIVGAMTHDTDLIVAAVLHDTVEDGKNITIEDIRREFGERVASLVGAETEDKSKTWDERKQHTLDHLKNQASREVKIVTLGDKLSNMRAIYRDYKSAGDELWQRFNVKDPKKHGWYYKGIADSLSELNDYQEYKEYLELVQKVFG